jgi:AcrR family transcriptional regulator
LTILPGELYDKHMITKMNTRSESFRLRAHDVTTQVLIEAAEKAIIRKGYDRVTMRDVAAEAGCVPGTLYLYFRNKQDLVRAILTRRMDEMIETNMTVIAVETDPLSKLKLMTQEAIRHFNRNQEIFKLLAVVFAGRPRDIRARMPLETRRKWAALQEAYMTVIRDAQEKGQMRSDFPPEIIWKFVHGLLHGYLDELTVRDQLPNQEEQMRTLWGLLTGGIGAREAGHA